MRPYDLVQRRRGFRRFLLRIVSLAQTAFRRRTTRLVPAENETKVSESDELLIKVPCVMKGYYKRPEKTAKVIDADGWYHTSEGESRDIMAEIYSAMSEKFVRKAINELNLTLPVYKRIKTVVFRKEPFPRTSSGKIRV